jgi:predicted transcriptional regulator
LIPSKFKDLSVHGLVESEGGSKGGNSPTLKSLKIPQGLFGFQSY